MVLKFTREQMMAHAKEDGDFAEWYVEDFMRKNLPDHIELFDKFSLCEMTLNGRKYARHFGFEDPEYQAHFITLMWTVGANFFEFTGFKHIIEDKTLSEKEKIDRIYKRTGGELAGAAIANSNEEYWYPELIKDNILGIPYDDSDED